MLLAMGIVYKEFLSIDTAGFFFIMKEWLTFTQHLQVRVPLPRMTLDLVGILRS